MLIFPDTFVEFLSSDVVYRLELIRIIGWVPQRAQWHHPSVLPCWIGVQWCISDPTIRDLAPDHHTLQLSCQTEAAVTHGFPLTGTHCSAVYSPNHPETTTGLGVTGCYHSVYQCDVLFLSLISNANSISIVATLNGQMSFFLWLCSLRMNNQIAIEVASWVS